MSRSRRVAIGLVTVAAVGGACLLYSRISASRHARPPGLTLLVNHSTRTEITPGTPLSMQVSISNGPNDSPLRIGSRWRGWHRLIWLERVGSSEPLPWRASPEGEPRSLEIATDAEGRPGAKRRTGPVAQLDRGRFVHTVTFAAGPADTASLAPGEYRVRAVLETPFWQFWGWRGRLVSATASIAIRAGNAATPALEVQRLSSSGAYYLRHVLYADAERVADELLRVDPRRFGAHLLRGDALAGLNRKSEALDAYRRALKLVPRSYETPDLVFQRIDALVRAKRSP
jgi:hypothetical protein